MHGLGRSHFRIVPQPSRGRAEVVEGVMRFFRPGRGVSLVVAEVNGAPGIVALRGGRPMAVIVLASRDGLVTGIYAIADEAKLSRVR